MPGDRLVQILKIEDPIRAPDEITLQRELPRTVKSDNDSESASKPGFFIRVNFSEDLIHESERSRGLQPNRKIR